jgi:hypothetical protein
MNDDGGENKGERIVDRYGIANDDVLCAFLDLMESGLLRWERTVEKSDCQYIAMYGGREFRLNCCNQNNKIFNPAALLVDGKRIDLPDDIINILCHRVPVSIGKQQLQENVETTEELVRFLRGK